MLENEIPELAVVAAVDHPAVGRQCFLDPETEVLGGRLAPIGAPVERVELDVRHAMLLGEPLGDGGLPGARRPDDGDPRRHATA